MLLWILFAHLLAAFGILCGVGAAVTLLSGWGVGVACVWVLFALGLFLIRSLWVRLARLRGVGVGYVVKLKWITFKRF